MSALNPILSELRDKRLWPVVVALLAGIAAVPLLLSKSPAPPSSAPPSPPSSLQIASRSFTPNVTLASGGPASPVRGASRNPFTQLPGGVGSGSGGSHGAGASGTGGSGSSGSGTSGGSGATGGASGGTSGTGGTGGAGGTSGTGGASGTGGTTGTGGTSGTSGTSGTGGTSGGSPKSPSDASKPAHTGLADTQSYAVALSLTTGTGGLAAVDGLERLSPIPSVRRPLLVDLGVLQGGHRVLFAVRPGTLLAGAGTCTPGPVDCQVLALAPRQRELVGRLGRHGRFVGAVQFEVTSIAARTQASAPAAERARRRASAAGRALLRDSRLSALSLFAYDPSVGAVVDLRNLTVGGS